MKKILIAMTILCFGVLAFAHPGKTDANGCHTNKKTGEYHCHNSKGSGKVALPAKKKPVKKKEDKKKKDDKKKKAPAKKEKKK